MEFIVTASLAWLALNVLFLVSAVTVARKRERHFRRSLATLLETAERHANQARSPTKRRARSGPLEAAVVRPPRRPTA